MNRIFAGVFAATLAFAVPGLIVAQGKADVSGEWTLNNNRSDPGVGGVDKRYPDDHKPALAGCAPRGST
jgi:hypothetical protein